MRDAQRIAARLLRITLGVSAALVGASVVLDRVGGGRWTHTLAVVGIAVVVAAPFVTLVVIAAVSRRAATAAYAVAGLLLALAGALIAR